MSASAGPPALSRRERLREQTLAEIKTLALEQIAGGGVDALSLNAIARVMGMSGPAIYRYFDGRSSLIDAVVADLYGQLGDALAQEAELARRRSPAARLRALAEAYRGWALAHPREYRLMTNEASPDHEGEASRIPAASGRAMELLLDALAAVAGQRPEDDGEARDGLSRSLRGWAERHEQPRRASLLRLGVLAWSRLHGLVALEITGVFRAMGIDAAALYRSEVEELVEAARET